MNKILLVEDDPILQELIADILKCSFPCEIVKVSDAFEAFNSASQQRFDLIISDYQMPYVDGLTFVRAMREKPKSPNHMTPVLILSGCSSFDLGFSQFSALRYLGKPPQMDHLIQSVEDLLASSLPHCELNQR